MDGNIISQGASQAAVTEAFKIDPTRGGHDGTVARQWAIRPDDQRFTSLNDLMAAVKARALPCKATIAETRSLMLNATPDDPDALSITIDEDEAPYQMSNWTFAQVAQRAQAPAGYLRKLPAVLAGVLLQHGLREQPNELVQAYRNPNTGQATLHAVTGPEYGRIYDHELVAAIQKFAGNGTGDTRWKVPGQIDWKGKKYNPFVDITKDTTTLYASDRDVFAFLVDDTHPIQIGLLDDGSPDYVFRGFYAWNSEVGSKTLGLATFLLRGTCMNRNLWGVEGFEELTIRHSKNAPDRFMTEAAPALLRYTEASATGVVAGINAAKNAVIATNDDERREWLAKQSFAKGQIAKILGAVENEEGHKARSVWDMVQGITAVARSIPHQDERLDVERKAGKLLAKAAARAA